MTRFDCLDASYQLLEELSDEFRDSNYDIRRMLRAIALTDAYQRSSRGTSHKLYFTSALLRPLTPEQMALSSMVATGADQAARAAGQRGR